MYVICFTTNINPYLFGCGCFPNRKIGYRKCKVFHSRLIFIDIFLYHKTKS